MRILKKGCEGEDVKKLQKLLLDMGEVAEDNPFWTSKDAKKLGLKFGDLTKAQIESVWVDGDFGVWTVEAVKHAQVRHLGPNKTFLEPTGIVDKDTWWALTHRSTKHQTQEISKKRSALREAAKAKENGSVRKAVLNTAYKYNGVREIPKGSNGGPIVDLFTNNGRYAWCASYTCYVFKEATGSYYAGPGNTKRENWKMSPSVWRLRKWSKTLGIFKEKGKEEPEIGDFYSINYGGGRGHTGIITGIKRNSAGKIIGIYTISGNESDQVKEGYRSLSSKSLVGFIDPYKADEVLEFFDRVNVNVKNSGSDKTR